MRLKWIALSIIIFISCAEEDEENPNLLTIKLLPAEDITTCSFFIPVQIENNANEEILEYGTIWGLSEDLDNSGTTSIWNNNFNVPTFTGMNIGPLESAETYYYKAYMRTSAETVFSSTGSATTSTATMLPQVTIGIFEGEITVAASNIDACSILELGYYISENPEPKNSGQRVIVEDNVDQFSGESTSSLGDLTEQTGYYLQAFATNVVGEGLSNTVSLYNAGCLTDMKTDIDGNTYQVVRIGSQIWFAENLKTTRFRNYDEIQNITNNETWEFTTLPGYSWYQNDKETYESFGLLYNFHAIDNSSICPNGYRVATREDWSILFDYLVSTTIYEISEIENTSVLFNSGSNSFCFNMQNLPGYRNERGIFEETEVEGRAFLWTNEVPDDNPNNVAYLGGISSDQSLNSTLSFDVADKNEGHFCRCIAK